MADVFGLLASGRLIRSDFVRIDATHFVMILDNPECLNHIAVFLTGSSPFPPDTAGLVYFSWSNDNEQNEWKLLGSISNEKPSAIFKISHAESGIRINSSQFDQPLVPSFDYVTGSFVAKIGISIESVDNVTQQTTALLKESYRNPSVALEFTKSMLSNFYNYASSFIVSADAVRQDINSSSSYIPLNVLETWFANFQRKLTIDPHFWKK